MALQSKQLLLHLLLRHHLHQLAEGFLNTGIHQLNEIFPSHKNPLCIRPKLGGLILVTTSDSVILLGLAVLSIQTFFLFLSQILDQLILGLEE